MKPLFTFTKAEFRPLFTPVFGPQMKIFGGLFCEGKPVESAF